MMPGDPVRAVLFSADVTTAAAIPIYKAGSETAYILQANEFFVITSWNVSGDAALNRVRVFVDTVGAAVVVAGNTLIDTWIDAITNTPSGHNPEGALCGLAGHAPHVIADVGTSINIILTGYIQEI